MTPAGSSMDGLVAAHRLAVARASALLRSRRARFFAAWIACVLLGLPTFRMILLTDAFVPGDFARGAFESLGGRTVLAHNSELRSELFPDIDLLGTGELALPPGHSVLVPLATSGLELRAHARGEGAVPYVVVGVRRPLADGERFDSHVEGRSTVAGGAYLDVPRVLTLDSSGEPQLLPWDASRSWRDDARWLAALKARCAPAGDAHVSVRATGDVTTVRYGGCAAKTSVPPTVREAQEVALVAGVGAATITREGGFHHQTRTARGALPIVAALLALHALLLCAGIAPMSGVAVSAALAAASALFPVEAVLGWLLVIPVGAGGLLVRGARWSSRSARRAALGVGTLAVAGAAAVFLRRGPDEPWSERLRAAEHDFPEGPARCLILGYSTVADSGLRFGTRGMSAFIDVTVPRCAGRTARVGWPGRRLDTLAETVCERSIALEADADVVVFGGVNDDSFWAASAGSPIDRLGVALAAIRMLLRAKRFGGVPPPADVAWIEETSRKHVDLQEAAIARMARCARERRARLWFVHDYVVQDLREGAVSAPRAAMQAHRRAAVEAGGGVFVSFRDATFDRAGVSWFSDVVHLSTLGHREAARVIAEALRAKPRSEE